MRYLFLVLFKFLLHQCGILYVVYLKLVHCSQSSHTQLTIFVRRSTTPHLSHWVIQTQCVCSR